MLPRPEVEKSIRLRLNFPAALESELARADILEPEELPVDVVSMGSTVWFQDLETDEVEQYTLVVPSEADVMRDRISVSVA